MAWPVIVRYALAGIGAGLLREALSPSKPARLAGAGRARAGTGSGRDGVRGLELHPAGDIDRRVSYIAKQLRADSLDKAVISEARAVLSGKCPVSRGGSLTWCVPEKSWRGEVEALYRAVTDPNSAIAVRYTRDHAEVDLFSSSALMRRLPAGDCDDGVIRLGALLRAVGYALRMRVVAPAGQPGEWSHIYLVVGSVPGEPQPSAWWPLDPTEPQHGPFWEVPRSMVSTVKDIPV